jgi:hypothetical protein
MRLALISRERSLPITLYARDYALLANIVNSLTFCVMGLILLPTKDYWTGIRALLFFGLCAAVMIHQLRTSAMWLRLDYAGFTLGSSAYEEKVPWDQIAEFVVVRPAIMHSLRKTIVGWRYATAAYPLNPAEADPKNGSVLPVDRTLPDTYGVSPRKLAEFMNELRRCHQLTERYLASSKA